MNVKKPVDRHDLLTAAEAAALLPQTTSQTVLRWAKEGLLPYVELPGGRRRRKFFRRADIEALLRPTVASAPDAGPGDAVVEGAPDEQQPMLVWPEAPAASGSAVSAPSPVGGGGAL